MMDPRCGAVLIRPSGGGDYKDRTAEVAFCEERGGRVAVTFANSKKSFPYSPDRAAFLGRAEQLPLGGEIRVEVRGEVWSSATEAWRLSGSAGRWIRIFYHAKNKELHKLYPEEEVRFVRYAAADASVAGVLASVQRIVANLAEDAPVRAPFSRLGFI
ncbi:MAG: hypothetical protein LBQ06_06980, partial [Frankiaceae bacterium]|nr:hypothetical protein [Frankiaceae bacterium]